MMKGDLIRCRDWRAEEKEWNDVGIVVEYDELLKTVKAVMQASGLVKAYRASDTELIKRAPQNVQYLKELAKSKKTLDNPST